MAKPKPPPSFATNSCLDTCMHAFILLLRWARRGVGSVEAAAQKRDSSHGLFGGRFMTTYCYYYLLRARRGVGEAVVPAQHPNHLFARLLNIVERGAALMTTTLLY